MDDKLKIGIFGDSFASLRFENENPTLDWVSHLAQKYNVLNFAKPGTSVYYSVKLFLKNFKEFDKTIFIVTHSSRLTLPERSYFLDSRGNVVDCLTPRSAQELLKDCKRENDCKILKSVLDYYTYIEDIDFNNYISSLMVNNLKEMHNELLLIYYEDLIKVHKMENDFFQLDDKFYTHYIDFRNCHLSKDNNNILFEKVDEWIKTSRFKFSINDFVKPSDTFLNYFRIKK